jgi:ligand-binding SRPBCC domain-containing protein
MLQASCTGPSVRTEFEWNHHFADVMDKSPFQFWHHQYEFTPEKRDGVDRTLPRDVIDYEVRLAFLGALWNRMFVRPEMRHTFAGRQKTLL